jgi:hypothetical protein
VVIDDLGLDIKDTKRALDLPPPVTMSFMPYATRLKEQTNTARNKRHELLLHMPMQPLGSKDPGPGALLIGLSSGELRQRFDTALASFAGFDGVDNHMGSKFTADPQAMAVVIDELRQRHLFFLDSRTSANTIAESMAREQGVPALRRDVFLDNDQSIDAIRRQFEASEHIARRKGYAVAIGHPHPATLAALEVWLPQARAHGFIFVPLMDLVKP